MRKIAILSSILLTLLLTATPLSLALSSTADNSDFFYQVQSRYVLGTPDGTNPQGLPLCTSASVVNLICYSPAFIRSAYNFPAGLDGTGQTILIVDAFGSPTIAADLAAFDAHFGLPSPPSFTIFCGNGGCPAFNPRNPHDPIGWAVETSLDVEYAHAMAPGANIVLVVAATNSGNALNDAEAAAIAAFPGSIMSQSFGIPEVFLHANNAQVLQAHANYAAAAAAGDTVLASAGDLGATNGFSIANALFPSSDPLVIAVGGTQGNPFKAPGTLTPCAGTCTIGLAKIIGPCAPGSRTTLLGCSPAGYGGEMVWNEAWLPAATGGSPSLFFSTPSYQSGLGLSTRTTPDISYNAAVDGGVLVYTTFLGFPHFFIVGGTSAGSPQWAAIFAIVNQARALNSKGPIGFANPLIYALTSGQKALGFHDITVGNNQELGTPIGFSAGPGWDDASGWGTPNVANLVTDLS